MSLNFGWQREDIIEFLETMYCSDFTAKTISSMLINECNSLYGGEPGDDTTVCTVKVRKDVYKRQPEKVYLKKGCLPVALDELKTVMGKKKAFIVTDSFLYNNGYTQPITKKLDEMGVQHTTFYNVCLLYTSRCV